MEGLSAVPCGTLERTKRSVGLSRFDGVVSSIRDREDRKVLVSWGFSHGTLPANSNSRDPEWPDSPTLEGWKDHGSGQSASRKDGGCGRAA